MTSKLFKEDTLAISIYFHLRNRHDILFDVKLNTFTFLGYSRSTDR